MQLSQLLLQQIRHLTRIIAMYSIAVIVVIVVHCNTLALLPQQAFSFFPSAERTVKRAGTA
jgi:hypothetical protein